LNDALIQQEALPTHPISYIHTLFDKAERILQQHRLEDPDLYRIVEEKKLISSKKFNDTKEMAPLAFISQVDDKGKAPKSRESIYFKQHEQKQLKMTIASNQKLIHGNIVETQSEIIPRTQARNIKQPHHNIGAITADRADQLEAQIKAWRSVLPVLIKRFAKISDPRRANSVKHK